MWQWAHLLGFNLYWLLAVRWQQPGPLLGMLLLHFIFSPRRGQDWRLIPVALAGCLLDILLWRLGLFHFPSGFPLWLLLLWCGFALTLSHGLPWLRPLPRWQQGLFGMVGGASSYMAGAAMGAVNLPWGIWTSAVLLAVIWMWWLPVLLWVTVKLEGETR
ncbi:MULTISPECIES: DUF2878 domain-containing protein [Aeromonas]|jgi:hypothetical protein|uniref:DUF2878 domain-containing protein n=3 Tax=Aeromonas caviae TaxID=648 RepID=A0A6I4WJ94_AERCA|nr:MULTISPECIES: DUF2878 domain-containing protein [Aeromonas]AXB05855.1 DUF2878 domain-containing protein [Aeromonas caviae]MDH1994301.1 DUF2878 domain-containing protein [Aeromonas caviae]MDX7841805.1 DUF2878 domain-containing protein [Aeromonas caviae]MXQ68425.1 DUF2878 family protein [Aeromonas caviae]BDA19389.1 hypothetical protein KAM345_033030 [Aeromonas caviae]